MNSIIAQNKVKNVDLKKYAGKWFVIASIPTRFDKNWNNITESYSFPEKGEVKVKTTYTKPGKGKEHSVASKGFPDEESYNFKWKVQFVWPFKADYLIEELAEDYSYTVVGHPKKKFLYIMNRTGKMDHELYEAILIRCAKRGYDIGKIHRIGQN
jgi:apolipoprotein D and lipocalin family protein